MEVADYRKLLKQHHICCDCKKQDAYTIAGRTLCAECAEKRAEAARKKYTCDGGEKQKIATKKYREKNEKEHKCILCGKQLPNYCKYKTCDLCRRKARRRELDKLREKGTIPWDMRTSSEYCFQCAKKKPLVTGRLCKDCYGKKLETCMPQFEEMAKKGREIVRKELNKIFILNKIQKRGKTSDKK